MLISALFHVVSKAAMLLGCATARQHRTGSKSSQQLPLSLTPPGTPLTPRIYWISLKDPPELVGCRVLQHSTTFYNCIVDTAAGS
jgi:hypothetical protein